MGEQVLMVVSEEDDNGEDKKGGTKSIRRVSPGQNKQGLGRDVLEHYGMLLNALF